MKSKFSIIAIIVLLVALRLLYSEVNGKTLKVTTYDAFGYYMYLPAIFIYDDILELRWVESIDKKYNLTGGDLYQANRVKNGNHVFKYFGGVAIMQSPFFYIADTFATSFGNERDGFSKPYQIAIYLASLFYSILSLILLRWLLLQYFNDKTTAIVLLLVLMASNIPQYMSIDCGQTHSYLFFLYSSMLVLTKKWHDSPGKVYAFLIGMVSGLGIIIRPTEAIIIIIPLLWSTHTKISSGNKWEMVRIHKSHVLLAILGGTLTLIPQLIYWKIATGSFIYDVGSKWSFLNPFFRVLFGWEKGWFIYTPVAILFILSLFYIKKYEFKRSIWIFTIINIWIIISWFDWRYGGSYSTRALSHSYPIFALSMGGLVSYLLRSRLRYILYVIGPYLIFVNLFQIYQYNENILHYDHMNKDYYSRIYLNPSPSPLDYSLLDTKDWIKNTDKFNIQMFLEVKEKKYQWKGEEIKMFATIENIEFDYVKVELKTSITEGFWNARFHASLNSGETRIRSQEFRLNIPDAHPGKFCSYEFYMEIPQDCNDCSLALELESDDKVSVDLKSLNVFGFTKK